MMQSERSHQLPVEQYQKYLPTDFETREVRVFCRVKDKEKTSRKAFDVWCKEYKTHPPFPRSPFPPVRNDMVVISI